MKIFNKLWAKQPLRWIILTSGGWILWSVYDAAINKEKFINSVITLPLKINQFKIPTFALLIIFVFIAFIIVNLLKRIKKLAPNKYYETQADNQRMQKHINQLIEQMNSFYKGYEKLSQDDRGLLDEIKPFVDRICKHNIYFDRGTYWIKTDGSGEPEGPFCPRCKDDEKKLIHMAARSNSWYVCPKCDFRLQIKEKEDEAKNESQNAEGSELILEMLASKANQSLSHRDIEHAYLSKYPLKKESDLAILINDLKHNNLIEDTEYGDWGEIGYLLSSKGLDYLKKIKRK